LKAGMAAFFFAWWFLSTGVVLRRPRAQPLLGVWLSVFRRPRAQPLLGVWLSAFVAFIHCGFLTSLGEK